MEPWAEKYLGIPFLGAGRTRDGLDCYGLLILVSREEFGLELVRHEDLNPSAPDPDGKELERIRAFWDEDTGSEWQELALGDEVPGDAVSLNLIGRPHCGVVVGNGHMLHITQGMGAAIEPYTRGGLCRRVTGIYRHRLR